MSDTQSGDSNAKEIQIPSILFCILSPILVAIRFRNRIVRSGGLGADDWTIFGSLICSLLVSILMLASCDYGFGKHISTLSQSDRLMALKLFYVAQAFYKVSINMTKASILLLYLRIFVFQRFFRAGCWIMFGIVISYGIASTAAAIFQCTPIARAWDKSVNGTCINITTNWYANAGFSIATDLIILLLPMPIIYHLTLPTNQKLSLAFIFALGGFVVVTSILRMTTLDLSSTSPDTTFDITSSLWTIIENNIGIICACLPMCRQLLSFAFPKLFPTTDPHSQGRNVQFSRTHSGTGKSGKSGKSSWVPPRMNDAKFIELTSVAQYNNSEEHILQDGNQISKSGGEIRKVTEITVQVSRRDDDIDV